MTFFWWSSDQEVIILGNGQSKTLQNTPPERYRHALGSLETTTADLQRICMYFKSEYRTN
jgi:hypothetical protein